MNNYFKNDECWESGLEQIKNCGKAPETITVFLKPTVKRKIDLLMEKYEHREWLAYLVGKDYIIEDIIFPKQNATSARVDDIVFPDGVKVIGVMHSHHSMGIGFSGTDDEYINDNHDISILVAHNGIAGQVRWNTPCGCKKAVKAKIKIFWETNFDEKLFMEDVEEKMYVAPIVPLYPQYPQYGNRSWEWSTKQEDVTDVNDTVEENAVNDALKSPTLRDALKKSHLQ